MTPSQKIDEQIAKLNGDWRSEILVQYRELVKKVAPELEEDFKWNVGVFDYKKSPVLAFSSFKDHVKLNFFNGASLVDSDKLFNNGLDSKNHRSVDISKDGSLDEKGLTKLILEALEFEKSK